MLEHVSYSVPPELRAEEAPALPSSVTSGAVVEEVRRLALTGGDTERVTGLRIEIAGSGAVAWAAATLGSERATWVLERRAGNWEIVQSHRSYGIKRETLARSVFGRSMEHSP